MNTFCKISDICLRIIFDEIYAMLQVNVIRRQRDHVLERLAVKHFPEPGLVDQVIALDDRRKSLLTANEQLLAKRNAASREIGSLMGQGKKEEAEGKKSEVARLKEELDGVEKELAKASLSNIPRSQKGQLNILEIERFELKQEISNLQKLLKEKQEEIE